MTELFRACHNFVLSWEGEGCHQAAGEDWLTCWGIAQKFNPNHDWPITKEVAYQIAYEKYWVPSGAEALPSPLALMHFDFYFNAGPGRANPVLEESGHDFVKYATFRLTFYTDRSRPNRNINLPGWVNRVAACLDVAQEWDRAFPRKFPRKVSAFVDDRPWPERLGSVLNPKRLTPHRYRELPWEGGRKLHLDVD